MLTAAHCMCYQDLACKKVGSTIQVTFDPKQAVNLHLGINGKKVVDTPSFLQNHAYKVNDVIIHPQYKRFRFVMNKKYLLFLSI